MPRSENILLRAVEAVVLVVVFSPAIRMHSFQALVGFIIGALAFYSVIPGLKIVGPMVFEPIKRCEKGSPQPSW